MLARTPAIDGGDDTGAPGTGQCGVRRPRDGDDVAQADMGAFGR